LIYGLPHQSIKTIEKTLAEVVRIAPDRIAFYRLAVIPELFKWQKTFTKGDMPSAELALDLNLYAINYLTSHGYDFIGLDHFARHDEGLHQAFREGKLRRTFQGMTTGGTTDVIGFGPSAISILDDGFSQNEKNIKKWRARVSEGYPVVKGHSVTAGDRIRRELLQELYGYGRVTKKNLEKKYGIVFDDYFKSDLERLNHLVEEGLVIIKADSIEVVEPLGQLLLRVIAAVFDDYLPEYAFRDGMKAPDGSGQTKAMGSHI
jgi:oxygen-independent coproporphyrinogen-3 oxidase